MKKKKRITHVALIGAMWMSGLSTLQAQHLEPVRAGMQAPVSDSLRTRTQHLDDVEVRAKKPRSALSSVTPVQTITSSELQLLGITSVGDAAKRMAGVQVRDYGGIGGLQTVSVRSLGACHTAVSYDGIVVSNMQAGQIDVSRYSLSNIRQLSVAIGQGSDLMQSARHYASAGILSIESRGIDWTSPQPWQLKVNAKTGSWGLFTPSLQYSQRLSSQTALTFDANMVRADGVYPFTIQNGRYKEHHKRYNSDILSGQGEVNLFHRWDKNELSAKVSYYNSKRGLPGVVILYNSDAEERMWDESCFAQMVWKSQLAPRLALNARLKYAHTWSKYEDYNVKYQGGKLTDIARQNEYYASATIGYNLGWGWTTALAEDFSIGDLRTNVVSQPNPTRYSSQTAWSLRWKWQRWQVDGNLVGTYISEKASKEDKGSSDSSSSSGSSGSSSSVNARIPADRKRISPSIAMNYRLLADETLYLRAMMKSTYRVPTFTDMYYLHIGNTNLKPENATEWNLGVTWAHQFGGKTLRNPARGISLQATLDTYYNKVTDKIVAFPTTYVWKMVNFGRVEIKGVDATLSFGVPMGEKMALDVDVSYTYQYAVDKTDSKKSYYRHQLPYTPRHSGNVSAVWRNPWVSVGWQMQAVGERWSMIQCTDEYRMKAYQEHTFTLSREFSLGKRKKNIESGSGARENALKGNVSEENALYGNASEESALDGNASRRDFSRGSVLKLSFSLLNAFNKQYEVIKYYPMPGRSWQATASLTL